MYNHHLIYFKEERNYFQKVHRYEIKNGGISFSCIKNFLKRDVKMTTIFWSNKSKSKSAPWIYISFPSKLHQKIHRNVNFLFIEIRSKKVHQNDIDFLPIEIASKYVEMRSIFRSSKLRRTSHVETTSIFRTLKLHL